MKGFFAPEAFVVSKVNCLQLSSSVGNPFQMCKCAFTHVKLRETLRNVHARLHARQLREGLPIVHVCLYARQIAKSPSKCACVPSRTSNCEKPFQMCMCAFTQVKLRECPIADLSTSMTELDTQLCKQIEACQREVHSALLDNINTGKAMTDILGACHHLISAVSSSASFFKIKSNIFSDTLTQKRFF